MKVIEVQHAARRNGDFQLQDISFSLEPGYITGLIGPNGAGKTTLIKALMNLNRLDKGEVRIFGSLYPRAEREIKRRIGFVYDESYFYSHLSVDETGKVLAGFYPTWKSELFLSYLRRFDIPSKRKVGELSKGMKTKFALAAALAHEPELLIMDEPTSGLDPVFRREVLALLSEYIQQESRSVLFSTHITADLDRIADYIVYLNQGRLHFAGSKEELMDTYRLVKGPNHSLTQEVRDHVLGLHETPVGFEGLVQMSEGLEQRLGDEVKLSIPTLDDILVYTRGERIA
jgi:ABC-2 type transport system ATP-binding protein